MGESKALLRASRKAIAIDGKWVPGNACVRRFPSIDDRARLATRRNSKCQEIQVVPEAVAPPQQTSRTMTDGNWLLLQSFPLAASEVTGNSHCFSAADLLDIKRAITKDWAVAFHQKGTRNMKYFGDDLADLWGLTTVNDASHGSTS